MLLSIKRVWWTSIDVFGGTKLAKIESELSQTKKQESLLRIIWLSMKIVDVLDGKTVIENTWNREKIWLKITETKMKDHE